MPHLVIIDKRAMEVNFLASNSFSGTGTGVNFGATALGGADPERYILVGVGTSVSGGGLPTSVTIGGISATRVQSSSLGTNPTADLWHALVPTGTTGAIIVNYSGSATRAMSIGVYSILPVLSSTYSSAKGGVGVAPLTALDTIDVPATGIVIAVGCAVGTGGAVWSGLTEDCDFVNNSLHTFSMARYQSTSGDTAKPVSATFATGTVDSVVFAVFGP